jgi:hypothetical protein
MQQILQDDGLAHRVRTHEATFSKTSCYFEEYLLNLFVLLFG